MFVKIMSQVSTSTRCNAAKNSPMNVYKSVHKHFIVTTRIEEKNNKVFIDRNIIWYDSKKHIYRKRREVQSYDCDDFCEVNDDIETYDEEFEFYNKYIGNAMKQNFVN